MNLLIAAGLPDHKLDNVLSPLVALDEVDSIYLARRKKFDYPKVTCYPSPSWLQKLKVLAEIHRCLNIIFICCTKKIDCFVGIYLFPHCLYLGAASVLLRKPLIVSIIEDPSIYEGNILFKRILKKAAHIFVRGKPAQRYLNDRMGLDVQKISILKDVLDFDITLEAEQKKEFDLIFVGYLTSAKRVDLLCDVIARVAASRPEVSVALLGEGPQERKLKKNIEKFNIQKNVALFGFQKDVYPFIKRSKILVLTSDNEGLPFVLIEALICEVPFVSFRIGDITDITEHEVNALLVRPFDTQQFAEYCLRLLEDTSFYEKLGANNRQLKQKMKEEYTLQTVSNTWKDVLKKICP